VAQPCAAGLRCCCPGARGGERNGERHHPTGAVRWLDYQEESEQWWMEAKILQPLWVDTIGARVACYRHLPQPTATVFAAPLTRQMLMRVVL
jgi:hypothetical protein